MKVFARRGDSAYLVSLSDDLDAAAKDPEAQGRVLDLEQGIFFPVWNIQSILARGYWVEASLPDEELRKLISSAKDAETEAAIAS